MTMDLAPQGHTTMTTRAPLVFSDDQRALIRDAYTNGASDEEFAVLMEIARARQLNPLLRQIHFVKRWDSEKRREVWSAQVSIDGLRSIAERTGVYAGQDEPEFIENPDGTLRACKVRVYRRDWGTRAAVGVAYYEEFVQKTREGKPNRMWAQMPRVMLSKVAESIALRKAFPEDAGGLYTPEEMGQADNDRPEPESPRRASSKALQPGDLDALGVEQRGQRKALPRVVESVAHDPETGEVVESPAPPADAVPGVVADVERRAAECGSADDLAAVWRERQADLRAAGKGLTMAAWRHVVARCADLGIAPGAVSALVKAADSVRPAADDLGAAEEQLRAAGDAAALAQGYAAASALLPQHAAGLWSLALSLAARAGADETTLRRMVLDRGGTVPGDGPEKGPSGPQGGRKGARGGKPVDARGDAREGAANDGATALDLTRVSDAAEGILSRHGGNAFALRASIRKHAAELRADDVAVLADALARVTPADEHGARLTREGASAIVRGLLGLRRAA